MPDGIPLFVPVCIGTESRYAIVCRGVSFHPTIDGIIPPHCAGRAGVGDDPQVEIKGKPPSGN